MARENWGANFRVAEELFWITRSLVIATVRQERHQQQDPHDEPRERSGVTPQLQDIYAHDTAPLPGGVSYWLMLKTIACCTSCRTAWPLIRAGLKSDFMTDSRAGSSNALWVLLRIFHDAGSAWPSVSTTYWTSTRPARPACCSTAWPLIRAGLKSDFM